ncbi:MAG: family 20 glycosylhydrolase [Cytophagales bacterium]|nr:family 20 glycosylhydrolase [Cytophagales bacterium]
MKYVISIILATVLSGYGCQTKKNEVKPYNKGLHIVPLPAKIMESEGVFKLNKNTKLVFEGEDASKSGAYLIKKIMNSTGFELEQSDNSSKNFISLSVDPSCDQGPEGYCLTVASAKIQISSSTGRGLFYGVQTLLQLFPAEIESKTTVRDMAWEIPCVEINDKPRFKWRGMHLDVCRHFFTVDFIKKQLDVMAMYKMNTFHWHLTEDQAWRIEIKKYPKLTEIGSKRVDEGKEHGGYYTQEQVKEIVDYAAERFIDVVPEIELPGHALAALTAYPEYSCTGGPFKVRNVWGVEPDIYCAGNDETFTFIENILDEVATLFPYEYFHIGGDEAPKDRWKECAKCQARIRKEGLHDEHELQSYFIKRAESILLKRNKKMIGWDEILEGGLAQSASVMSWRGEQGGITAASQGHDVVMTPGNWVYLDHYQGSSKVEPVAIGGYTTLEESYGYDPVPEKLDPERVKHILGTQGNVWSEYMYSPELAEYRIYPRIIALAEVNWTAPDRKDYHDFLRRMDNHFVRLDYHDINYHIPLPEGPVSKIALVDSVVLKFATTRPTDMYYTLDGSAPDLESMKYTEPFVIKDSKTVKIRTALLSGKMSPVRTIQISKQEFRDPVDPEEKNTGLSLKIAQGEFYTTKDIAGLTDWKEEKAVNLKQTNSLFNYHTPSVGIFEGYLEVPEDDIYEFSTDTDEFYIAGELLIDNDGEVKRYSRNDASIALRKGLHPVKMVFVNNVYGGWPQAWNGFRISYKRRGDSGVVKLQPEDFVH